ncbi:MAG: hypothetical protein J5759_03015 [Bacteroidales bacterium]|nr:hypothetical protein [Bacteroidales bacterium]
MKQISGERPSDRIVRGPSVLSQMEKRRRSDETPSDGIVRGSSVPSRKEMKQISGETPRDRIVRGPSVLSRRGRCCFYLFFISFAENVKLWTGLTMKLCAP